MQIGPEKFEKIESNAFARKSRSSLRFQFIFRETKKKMTKTRKTKPKKRQRIYLLHSKNEI